MRNLALSLALVLCTGCATIVNGERQDLHITSQPDALCVTINGTPYGSTPVVADLERGQTHVVKVEYKNFVPYEATIVPVVSAWTWGNAVAGGLVGLVVDTGTGAMYRHSQERVHAYFPAEQGAVHVPHVCPVSEVVVEMRRLKQIAETPVKVGAITANGH